MPTQPHDELPPLRTPAHSKQISDACSFHSQTARALDDLDSLLIAALCVLNVEEGAVDMNDDEKRQTLETLMQYGRGAVDNGKEGFEEVWKVTADYLFGYRRNVVAETEEATQEEPP
jgi:hypothetical protein